MKIISRNMHGKLDYAVGALLIVSPWLFDYETNGAAALVALATGCTLILYSLATRYEWGIAGLIPFNVHLMMDFASGVLLAISPWLFGFADAVYLPHLILGVGGMMTSVMTQRDAVPHITFGTRGPHAPPPAPTRG